MLLSSSSFCVINYDVSFSTFGFYGTFSGATYTLHVRNIAGTKVRRALSMSGAGTLSGNKRKLEGKNDKGAASTAGPKDTLEDQNFRYATWKSNSFNMYDLPFIMIWIGLHCALPGGLWKVKTLTWVIVMEMTLMDCPWRFKGTP